MKQNKTKGFTLTELLVVIVISGILFSIIAVITSSFYLNYRSTLDTTKKNNQINEAINNLSLTVNYANLNGYIITVSEDSLSFDNKTLVATTVEGSLQIQYEANTDLYEYVKSISFSRITSGGPFDLLQITLTDKNDIVQIRTLKILSGL